MKDYDPILEELHYKYSDSVHVAPEIKLIMALASSVFFYHTGHQMSAATSNSTPDFDEPSSTPRQGVMRGPKSRTVSQTPEPVVPNLNMMSSMMSGMMPGMMAGLTGFSMPSGNNSGSGPPMPKLTDILSGMNMVQTLMKNPSLNIDE